MSSLPSNPIQQLPPERGRKKQDCVVLYSCCCCCCCCLHTVGGMIGATIGSISGNYQADENPRDYEGTKLISSSALYWLSFVATLGIGMALVLTSAWEQGSGITDPLESLWTLGLSVILFGPAFTLGAGFLMAIFVLAHPKMRRDRGYWRAVGKVLLATFVGTLVGTGVMLLGAAALGVFA